VEDPSIHRLLYLDIDVIVGKPLPDFFDDYEESLSKANHNSSFVSLFVSPERKRQDPDTYVAHTGIMVLDRQHSPSCLLAWQRLFDKKPKVKWDQTLLARMVQNAGIINGTTSGCRIHALDIDRHLLFPEERDLKARTLQTFIHMTRKRAERMDDTLQEDYLATVLKLDDTTERTTEAVAAMIQTFG
jgi:hypothetical protein